MNLLSFEHIDKLELFLEGIYQFILLSLKSLVCCRQLLHSLLLVINVLLHNAMYTAFM